MKNMKWTDIEFVINPKMDKETVYLGKHQLRFKTKLVNDFPMKAGERFKLGFDKTENPKKHIYLVRCDEGETGFLFNESKNHTYSIAFKGLFRKLNILEPQNAKYSIEDNGQKRYIKIIIPNFDYENTKQI